MAETILVGVDDSDCGRRAALFAAAQAKRSGSRITLACVVEWSPYTIYTHDELETRHGERATEIERAESRILQPLKSEIDTLGLTVETLVRHGHASRVLIDLARELGASQIVIGRRGRSRLAEVVFGSTASNLVQASPVPVTVVP